MSEDDLVHLRRCIELAREALDAGDEPFGSLVVDAGGSMIREERNRTGEGDPTAHPELALARWAAANLSGQQRAQATVYTSGEHCPMCAAAHGWVGLGTVVYAASAMQLAKWRADLEIAPGPIAALPIRAVVPGVVTRGPAPELESEMRALHRRHLTG